MDDTFWDIFNRGMKGVIHRTDGESRSREVNDFIRFLKTHNEWQDEGYLLNVGIGDCEEAIILQKAGLEVLGVSHSQPEVDNAIKEMGVPAFCMDAHQITLESEMFDYIYLHDTMEHFISPIMIFTQFRRLLKMGGVLGFHLPWIGDTHNWTHWFLDSPRALFDWLMKFGFRLLHYHFEPYSSSAFLYVAKKVELAEDELQRGAFAIVAMANELQQYINEGANMPNDEKFNPDDPAILIRSDKSPEPAIAIQPDIGYDEDQIQPQDKAFYEDDHTLSDIKPWMNKVYTIGDQQDDPAFWNRPDIVIQGAYATAEETKKDRLAGLSGWSPGGMIDILTKFCKRHNIPNGIRVLEIGCGGGQQMLGWDAFSRQEGKGFILSGLDHAQGAIDVIKERLPELEFICAPATDLPFTPKRTWDLIYTLTCLQHNSAHKLFNIFDGVYAALSERGIFYLMNELTRDSAEYPKYHPEFVMAPWSSDDRGSAGTAAWWIGFICDHGFELLEYYNSSYVFRKI